MKSLAVVLLSAAFVVVTMAADAKYSNKYDSIDLDEILQNERLYNKYFDCLANRGKCTVDGKELKENLPDGLATKCGKCSEKQKAGIDKVLKFVLEKKPEDFAVLEKIYDPTGSYKKEYAAEAEKRGYKLPN